MKTVLSLLALLPFFTLSCSEPAPPSEPAAPAGDPLAALAEDAAALAARSEHDAAEVEVQHILISFAGTPRTRATRSREEAERLAGELLLRIRAGEDFSDLVTQYTDDSPPGIYTMTKAQRAGMVKGFGDVAWKLDVGEVGVSPYDPQASPYGWHLIKRLR